MRESQGTAVPDPTGAREPNAMGAKSPPFRVPTRSRSPVQTNQIYRSDHNHLTAESHAQEMR